MNNESSTRPFRWSIRRAGIEFVCGHHRIMQGLRATGAKPDRQGTYTTKQIVAAILRPDALTDRAREAKLKQQILAMETAKLKFEHLESQLINVSEIRGMWADAVAKIGAWIRSSKLSPVEKKRLEQVLAELKLEEGK
jgi:hypothetical protein